MQVPDECLFQRGYEVLDTLQFGEIDVHKTITNLQVYLTEKSKTLVILKRRDDRRTKQAIFVRILIETELPG